MTESEMQYYGGAGLLIVGILVIVVAAIALSIKVLRDAFANITNANFQNVANSLDTGAIITALLSNLWTLVVIFSALVIWLGIVLMNGGSWLFGLVVLDDPRPDVIAEALRTLVGAA